MKRARLKSNPKNRQRVRIRRSSILILVVFMAIVGSSAWQIWKLRTRVEDQLAQLNQEKTKLLQREKILNDEITRLNTPSYIEQLAREQLGLVKQGEILISPKN
ncbi:MULTISPECIES: FtsB family cell division protein [Desulfosporosinus]|uniref:Septum formation initiator family protein n=1 Tax=Desulfosporosinus nitroreducens TaxID=2018668 RepID=A0ABT8QTI0_9FIRM|nr:MULTISPECIES: septum formation initiator family protein [Desulfosporosinus]MCO1604184.1 septum formation initiator family protein [Desulfosporosinus nitroreducens]MDA8221221.1 septum formation initiator family protein [Desulfitobacterium hafniense]MDO0823935.1 septum formation initiator family protein [Desulfosporosinus nitroreducens]